MAQKKKNPIKAYFDEIGDQPLLTKEEEKKLAQRIEQGDDEARTELINHNLKLVVSIAKKYRNYGIPFPDLIQEGNMGLIRAVNKFDWRKGNKFSTYATWWIRQSIIQSLNQKSRTIRLPAHKIEKAREIDRVEKEIIEKTGKRPTLDQITAKVDFSKEMVKKVRIARKGTSSLDKPLKKDEETSLADTLVSNETTPAEKAEAEKNKEKLKQLLNTALTDREKQVLKRRYGLEDWEPRTLREVGKIFDLSRERIRQLQNRAIEKLQKTENKTELTNPKS